MKKTILCILLFISCIISAQDFKKKWDIVVTYENEGKIKSAAKEVDKIYKKAKQYGDDSEVIRALLHKMKYLKVLDETAQSKILALLRSERNTASQTNTAILNYIYAECLTQYFKQNSYIIEQQTTLQALSNPDLKTWDKDTFEKEIENAYLKSIHNKDILMKTPLRDFELLIDFEKLEDIANSTLYDFLLDKMIIYYTSTAQLHILSTDPYKNLNPILFSSGKEFINTDFIKVNDPYLKRLLLALQLKENNRPNNKNIIFERVRMLSRYNIIHPSYFNFLNEFGKLVISDTTLHQEIQFQKASFYAKTASKKIFPENNIKAITVLDSILNIPKRSNTNKNAFLLKNDISSKSLNFSLQNYSYPNENIRMSVKYKNIDSLYLDVYKLPHNLLPLDRKTILNDSIILKNITTLQLQQRLGYALPVKTDFFEYTTEVLLPQFNKGKYLLIFKKNKDVVTLENLSYSILNVTNFSLLIFEKDTNEYVQIFDRKTGAPIPDVQIKRDSLRLSTDSNGMAFSKKKYPTKPMDRKTLLQITKDSDSLSLQLQQWVYPLPLISDKEDNNDYADNTITLYTDRAIYRPGQTVFIKGIAHLTKNKHRTIVANLPVQVVIENPDGTEIHKSIVNTNEFGSFTLSLILPKNIITGQFQINIDEPEDDTDDQKTGSNTIQQKFWDRYVETTGTNYFSIEEYKRPTFEISFNPVKEIVTLNKNIQITGKANSFSGSAMSNTKVNYRIIRKMTNRNIFFPFKDDSVPITHNETTTDGNGKFEINFFTVPDSTIMPKDLPIFIYTVYVDITDSNGETRSNETIIRSGYHSITLKAEITESIDPEKKNTIKLNSKNLNQQFTPTKGELFIYYQSPLQHQFKKRIFEKPEIPAFSDAEFGKLFPFEDNNDSKDTINGTLVFSRKVNTATIREIPLDFIKKWKSGNYKLVFATQDAIGVRLKDESFFNISRSQKNETGNNNLFIFNQINDNPIRDGYVMIQLQSAVPDLFIDTEAFSGNQSLFEDLICLKEGSAIFKIPLKDTYEHFINIRFSVFFDNDYFEKKMLIDLNRKTEKLEIEVLSFRNRIEPGAEEKWRFKIKQPAAKAEVLASMYDSSLDQFRTENWDLLPVKTVSGYNSWKNHNHTFGKSYTNFRNLNAPPPLFKFSRQQPEFIWYGFDFNNSKNQNNSKEKKQYYKTRIPNNTQLIHGFIRSTDGFAIPGVAIEVLNSGRYTSSDIDGYYEIDALAGQELGFSSFGFKPLSLKIKGRQLDVNMKDDNSIALEEVAIYAYHSTIKFKSNVSSSVTSKTFEKRPNASIIKTLQGQVSGLNITTGDGEPGNSNIVVLRGSSSITNEKSALFVVDGLVLNPDEFIRINPNDILDILVLKDIAATSLYGSSGKNGVVIVTTKKSTEALSKIQTRKNFNETAFFFPQLQTDQEGNFDIQFTSPEALTQWKLRLLAHNKEVVSGYFESSIITQKELMLTPNLPRFVREKDTLTIVSKVSNLTPETKSGNAMLQLYDATTMQSLDTAMLLTKQIQTFKLPANGSTTVSWKINVPTGISELQYKIVAQSGNFSDGEENIMPVLSNSIVVTESIPLQVNGNSTREFTLENLKNNTSSSLKNIQLTLEYTNNPTWLALQSLPYLMQYEHECSEQTFARFYANAIAAAVIVKNPKIAAVFDEWKKSGKTVSKLEQNEELKSLLLAESPWLSAVQSSEEQKQKLALLFDLEKMKSSQQTILKQLSEKQMNSGGFPWFDGGSENSYITQHIVSGFGHLEKIAPQDEPTQNAIVQKAISYLDTTFLRHDASRVKNNKNKSLLYTPEKSELHYLYARSFWLLKFPMNDSLKQVSQKYIKAIPKNWLDYSLYEKGMAALVLHRFGETANAAKIIVSLKETAANNTNFGMYWIENKSGWYWYQAPVETQSLLIEAFTEIKKDLKSADAMKTWLVKNKQTQHWATTKATTEAVYALLLQGSNWVNLNDKTHFQWGTKNILTEKLSEQRKEGEAGYLKINLRPEEITADLATVTIKNKSNVPGIGGLYWQYLENIEAIKPMQQQLVITKELYRKATTNKRQELLKITPTEPLHIGDLVTVRLVITTAEDLEYIHLKDARAAAFEPVDVLSTREYKNGLSFYKSTKDTATHFFLDTIQKGTYVLEYDVRINNNGSFTNGITTIQSMYAPEFSAHTKGSKISIE